MNDVTTTKAPERVRRLTHAECEAAAAVVAQKIKLVPHRRELRLFGVPRGGIPAAYLVARAYQHQTGQHAGIAQDARDAHVLIDDIVGTGETRERWTSELGNRPFHSLFEAQKGEWLVFPWEATLLGSADDIPRRLLKFIGEDPSREGLRETPARFVKAWQAYTSGYSTDPSDVLKTFGDGAEQYDELVLVRDIPVYSHCEHHLAPFFGKAHVGYIPNGRVVGLSKLARLVDVFARRLQVQERMTQQIAHALNDALKPKGVGVVVECRHMCMEARGVRTQGSTTTTSALLGTLRSSESARAEFLRLIR